MEDMIKMRNIFIESANILDEFINLKLKEDEGLDVSKESESILGRFMIKMLELQALQGKM